MQKLDHVVIAHTNPCESLVYGGIWFDPLLRAWRKPEVWHIYASCKKIVQQKEASMEMEMLVSLHLNG